MDSASYGWKPDQAIANTRLVSYHTQVSSGVKGKGVDPGLYMGDLLDFYGNSKGEMIDGNSASYVC